MRKAATGWWMMPALLSCLSLPCFAGATVDEYARRLEEARKIATTLAEEDQFPASLITTDLNIIKKLLPPSEEIDVQGTTLKIDNQWLHDAIEKVLKDVKGDPEQRHSLLVDLSDGIDYLSDRVNAGMKDTTGTDPEIRARLDRILARPDYSSPELQESSARKSVRKIKEFLARLFTKLFGRRSAGAAQAPAGSSGSVFRVIIILATIAALLYGIFILLRHFPKWKRKKEEDEEEVREVLGEQIATNATPADLLSDATEYARKGEYRLAIRRAYIAALFELEQRGKLHLNRARTNRDYLSALRSDGGAYPPFSAMTGKFEHVWYGQQKATEEEFNQFVDKYRETTQS
jgi:hypothetical protein